MYDTDLLEIINVLTDSGVRDQRMSEAIQHIRSKMNMKGRWSRGVPVHPKGTLSDWSEKVRRAGSSHWKLLRLKSKNSE